MLQVRFLVTVAEDAIAVRELPRLEVVISPMR
jgi:hypothetical protein